MEDTIAEGFKGRRQLPYAHWICWIILKGVDRMASITELSVSPTRFPEYDMCQLMGWTLEHRVARASRQRPTVPESVEEQDEAVHALAEIELADLEA